MVEWRTWEARLGYDPEQAPSHLMEQVAGLFARAGKSAAAEVVPLLTSREQGMLSRLMALSEAAGIEARLPMKGRWLAPSLDLAPWETGREIARKLREELGGKTGPIENSLLNDLLEELAERHVPIGLGVYNVDGHHAILHFRKRNPAGIRFECARFLAESVSAPQDDIWLPLTDRGTARQKFQRAFAAEFLAPIDEIREHLGDSRTSESFEDVAYLYSISPLAIRSHLANHGLLAPEEVAV